MGGVGTAPAALTENIGKYYAAAGGFTTDKELASDYAANTLFKDSIKDKQSDLIYAITDPENNILLGITPEGKLITNDVNKQKSEESSLKIKTENSDYLFAITDTEENIVFAIKSNGDIHSNKNQQTEPVENQVNNFVGSSIKVARPEKIININFKTLFPLPTVKDVEISGEIEFEIDHFTFRKFAKLKVQGSSSAVYPKKNWTISLFNDNEYTDSFSMSIANLAYHSDFVFKSNWIDATHLRNIGTNRLWESMVQNRKTYPKREVEVSYLNQTGYEAFDTGALGHVEGFPAVLNINDKFYGIGNFNLGKKRENYNLNKSNKQQVQIAADTHADLFSFKDEQWDLRNPKIKGYNENGPIEDTEVKSVISRLWEFNNSSSTQFKSDFEQYYNIQNTIDYYLLMQVTYGVDIIVKNFILTTWDGVIWNFMPYDLDTVYGLHWAGTSVGPYNSNISNTFWNKFYNAFSVQIKARYAQLNNDNIITPDNLYQIMKPMERMFGQELYKKEQEKWPDLPSKHITSLTQIITWFRDRLTHLETTIFN